MINKNMIKLLLYAFMQRCNGNIATPDCLFVWRLSSHHHVEHHHQHKTDGKTNGAEIGVLTAGGFGDELLDHDIEHGTSSKGQQIGQGRHE